MHDIDAMQKSCLSFHVIESFQEVGTRGRGALHSNLAPLPFNLFPTLMSRVSSCTCIYLLVLFVPLETFSLIWRRHYIGEGLQI